MELESNGLVAALSSVPWHRKQITYTWSLHYYFCLTTQFSLCG